MVWVWGWEAQQGAGSGGGEQTQAQVWETVRPDGGVLRERTWAPLVMLQELMGTADRPQLQAEGDTCVNNQEASPFTRDVCRRLVGWCANLGLVDAASRACQAIQECIPDTPRQTAPRYRAWRGAASRRRAGQRRLGNHGSAPADLLPGIRPRKARWTRESRAGIAMG
jgi:hypothetical protein